MAGGGGVLRASSFIQMNATPQHDYSFYHSNPQTISISTSFPKKSIKLPMAPLTASATSTVGLSETFSRLKEKGKVAFIPYITAGDPDLTTTAEALKVLDACGSDIIELGVPYSDPLADGPVIQAAATRSLARGTNFNKILAMLKEVVPQLSCPVALFTYYNPILKRGVEKFMITVKDAGIHGLVVPDVPLEETQILRTEAVKNNIELVCHIKAPWLVYRGITVRARFDFLEVENGQSTSAKSNVELTFGFQEVLLTTPTTPAARMKTIVEASEGFVYLVSSIGVTGARASVSERVKSLLHDIKETTNKPVAVGFGISTPEHVKQVAGWGADGVIVGSAMVKLLGEATSPAQGLKELESFTKSLKSALS